MSNKRTRLSLNVSQELSDVLDEMAKNAHSTKSEVLRKSIALMEVALNEKNKGNHLGVFSEQDKMVKEIVGL